MKGGAHPCSFATFSFLDTEKATDRILKSSAGLT